MDVVHAHSITSEVKGEGVAVWEHSVLYKMFQCKALEKRRPLKFSSGCDENFLVPVAFFHGAQACLSGISCTKQNVSTQTRITPRGDFYGEDGEGCEDV